MISDSVSVEVPVEEWTYDFGPRRFMCRVILERGVIVQIQTLGYGSSPNEPR